MLLQQPYTQRTIPSMQFTLKDLLRSRSNPSPTRCSSQRRLLGQYFPRCLRAPPPRLGRSPTSSNPTHTPHLPHTPPSPPPPWQTLLLLDQRAFQVTDCILVQKRQSHSFSSLCGCHCVVSLRKLPFGTFCSLAWAWGEGTCSILLTGPYSAHTFSDWGVSASEFAFRSSQVCNSFCPQNLFYVGRRILFHNNLG